MTEVRPVEHDADVGGGQILVRQSRCPRGIYRVNTPMTALPGGFSFNQYLVVDDEPLLFHTGRSALFADVRDAIARVIPVEKLRWICFSHYEQDESGALGELLAVAPHARSGRRALPGGGLATVAATF